MAFFDPESFLCTPPDSALSVTLPQIVSRSRPPSAPASLSAELAASAPVRLLKEAAESGGESDGDVGQDGGRAGSRASSCGPAPSRSRGVEEFRVDPALRAALERLDAVRQRQPSIESFALERFLGGRPARRSGAPQGCATTELSQRRPPAQQDEEIAELEAAVDAYLAQTSGPAAGASLESAALPRPNLQHAFSTDLLLAAVRSPTPEDPWHAVDGSRSTSPGSTHLSCVASTGAISADSRGSDSLGVGRRPPPPPRIPVARVGPAAPPGAPPRRPGRRVLSARSRTSELPIASRGPLSARG